MTEKFLKPVLAFVVFCVMQLMGSMVMGMVLGVMKAIQGDAIVTSNSTLSGLPPSAVLVTILVTGILTVLVCWLGLRVINMREAFDVRVIRWFNYKKKFGDALFALIAAFLGVVALDLLTEMCKLPNLLGDLMIEMADSVWGLLVIGVMGPIVEELVFREGIIGGLTRRGVSPWIAILTSSLLFGVAHFNPVQIFFAGLMGIILGILYYKTGNVVLTSILHILNNSVAVVQMQVMGKDAMDYSFVEELGGMMPAIACVVISGGLCCYGLYCFWNNYTNKQLLKD